MMSKAIAFRSPEKRRDIFAEKDILRLKFRELAQEIKFLGQRGIEHFFGEFIVRVVLQYHSVFAYRLIDLVKIAVERRGHPCIPGRAPCLGPRLNEAAILDVA